MLFLYRNVSLSAALLQSQNAKEADLFCWFSIIPSFFTFSWKKFKGKFLFHQPSDKAWKRLARLFSLSSPNCFDQSPRMPAWGPEGANNRHLVSSTSCSITLIVSRQTEAYKATQVQNEEGAVTLVLQQTDQGQKWLPRVDLVFLYSHASILKIPTITKKMFVFI